MAKKDSFDREILNLLVKALAEKQSTTEDESVTLSFDDVDIDEDSIKELENDVFQRIADDYIRLYDAFVEAGFNDKQAFQLLTLQMKANM